MTNEWFLEQTVVDGELVLTRILTEEEARHQLRFIRQGELEKTDYYMLTDVYNSLTATQQTELVAFRQGLRDLPASPDPFNPDYPTKPDWL